MRETYKATIEIERPEAEEPITVTVEGEFARERGSDNPNENGMRLQSWEVVSPEGVELTPKEKERAEDALYEAMYGG